jgi:hypothetical protein
MTAEDKTIEALKALKNNLPLFAKNCLRIVNEEGQLVPLEFNEDQLLLHGMIEEQLAKIGMVRMVVLKGRKQGVSTYVAARFFHKAFFNSYKQVYILSHLTGATKALFRMVNIFYLHLPAPLRGKLLVDNSLEMGFDNHSMYTVATAGEGEVGRGSTPHLFHGSEVASYTHTDGIETGIFQAIAMQSGTEMILESTAKGIGNIFHKYAIMALEKTGLYELAFLPWFLHKANSLPIPKDKLPFIYDEKEKELLANHPNITNEQLYWRRMAKAGKDDWMFKQEFPATIQEAFQTSGDSFIDGRRVYAARKSTVTDNFAPYIVGIDAARSGDRTIFVHRKGRAVIKVEKFSNMDEMRLVGLVSSMINKVSPDKVFIDVASAYGAIDRLKELGFGRIVQGVHNSESPMNPELYVNKRAETAFALRDWFDEDVSIPDDDDIMLDILAIPMYKESSNGKFQLESKANIKKSFGKSPDIFDAFCLTFAYPVRNNSPTLQNTYQGYNGGKTIKKSEFISPVMKSFNRDSDQPPNNSGRNSHFER